MKPSGFKLCLAVCAIATVQFTLADVTGASWAMINGNQGATLTCEGANGTVTASSSDTSVATVSVADNVVTVSAAGTAGIATITLADDDNTATYEVPVGLTTFVFDGANVTVYEGTSTNYELTGVEETDLSEKSQSYLQSNGYYVENEDGSVTYSPPVITDKDYVVCVGLKKKGGTYVLTGKGTNACVKVKKEATAATTVYLANLDLTASFTAPLAMAKGTSTAQTATIHVLAGTTNALTDAEYNNDDEYGEDAGGTNALAESACIKAKTNKDVVLEGSGTLTLTCNSKNAIKVGESSTLTIGEVDLRVVSAKHGISADNEMTIESGTIAITCENDAIRSDPDAVTNGVTSGSITVNGGTFAIDSHGDGFQAASLLTITDGVFDMTCGGGYACTDYTNSSCKAFKSSCSTNDAETVTNRLVIVGGDFTIDSADDAIHSDGYVTISNGVFSILTGDDAVHADTQADLGYEGAYNYDLVMTVGTCYEGLEAGTLNVYSGVYDITASDDGVNAAGGSSDDETTETDPGAGGASTMSTSMDGNSGSSMGGSTGGSMGNESGPGSNNDSFNPGQSGSMSDGTTGSAGDYSVNIFGGRLTVKAGGDGLDSNGDLYILGGTVTVWGATAGSADQGLDCDGSLLVSNATVFAAGSSDMTWPTPISGSQSYITDSSSYASDATITVTENGSAVFSATAPWAVNYVFWSSPTCASGTTTISSATASDTATSAYTTVTEDGETVAVIPNDWLDYYGLTASASDSTLTYDEAAVADTDGDGCLNWQEYIANSDPTDETDYFRLVSFAYDPEAEGEPVSLAWEPDWSDATGSDKRAYTIQGKASLDGTAAWTSFDDSMTRAEAIAFETTNFFYRVLVALPD